MVTNKQIQLSQSVREVLKQSIGEDKFFVSDVWFAVLLLNPVKNKACFLLFKGKRYNTDIRKFCSRLSFPAEFANIAVKAGALLSADADLLPPSFRQSFWQ